MFCFLKFWYSFKSKANSTILGTTTDLLSYLVPLPQGRNIVFVDCLHPPLFLRWWKVTLQSSFCVHLSSESARAHQPDCQTPWQLLCSLHLKFLNPLWFSNVAVVWSLSFALATPAQSPSVGFLSLSSGSPTEGLFLLHTLPGPSHPRLYHHLRSEHLRIITARGICTTPLGT